MKRYFVAYLVAHAIVLALCFFVILRYSAYSSKIRLDFTVPVPGIMEHPTHGQKDPR